VLTTVTPTHFAMTFAPSADLITPVRRFVLQFFEHVLGAGAECSRVALATHELLENAVRFSSGGETSMRVAIAPLGSDCLVTIRTRNDASSSDVRRLLERVGELSRGDAHAFYTAAMHRSVAGDGGLGLARIRAEADMDLICDVEGNEVGVRAQARVNVKR